MRRGLLALVAALASLAMIVAAGPASGDPMLGGAAPASGGNFSDYPPALDVYKDAPSGKAVLLQRTRLASFAWRSYSNGRWSLTQGTGVGGWPQADTVRASKFVYLRYYMLRPPDDVRLRSYNNPDMRGKPIYLKPGWIPVKKHRKIVGWDILFKLERAQRQHYIAVHAFWRKRPGKHYSWGSTEVNAHLKTY